VVILVVENLGAVFFIAAKLLCIILRQHSRGRGRSGHSILFQNSKSNRMKLSMNKNIESFTAGGDILKS